MAVSRPLIVVLVACVVALAGMTAMRAARSGDDGGAQAAGTAAAAVGTPESGRFSATIAVEEVQGASNASAKLSGRFDGRGKGLPRFDLALDFEAGGQSGSFGAVSTGKRAFVRMDGRTLEVPSDLVKTFGAAGGEAPAAAPDPAAALDVSTWLGSRERKGTEELDGVTTVHEAATLDVPAMLTALSGASQATGGPALDPATAALVPTVVKDARVEVWTGQDDGIVRRLRLDVAIDPPDGAGAPLESARLRVALDLTEVNRPQEIATPSSDGKLPLDDLQNFLPGLPSGTAGAGAGPAATAEVETEGVPKPIARAISRKQVVVLFLAQERGADDAATRQAVRAVRRVRGVAVFSDGIGNLERYRGIVAELGVSQAPAIVIVRPDGKAELLEGFHDAGSLVQQVADARG